MAFKIRKADENDVELLCRLGIKTFSDTFEQYNTAENMKLYIDQNFSREHVQQELRDAASTFLLVYDYDTIVGYTKVCTGHVPDELADIPALEIERIYSVKEYIGKRVGKALMGACLDLANEQGFKAIWLGVWEHNPRAIAFYQKWGFEKFSEHTFILGTDAQTDWMMKKMLTIQESHAEYQN